jgi:hypothetical protein
MCLLHCVSHIVRCRDGCPYYRGDDVAGHNAEIACLAVRLDRRHQGSGQLLVQPILLACRIGQGRKLHTGMRCLLFISSIMWVITPPSRMIFGHSATVALAVYSLPSR